MDDTTVDGHWHLWADDVDMGPVFTYTKSIDLSFGTHTLMAELRDSKHNVLGPMAEVTIIIEPYRVYLPLVLNKWP